jgi:hypothetical protein
MFNLTKILSRFYLLKQNLAKNISDLFSCFFIKIYLSILVLLNFLVWFVAARIYSQAETPQIALHYNVDFGIDLYDSVSKIFIVSFLGLLLIIINLIIVLLVNYYQRPEVKFISHILLATAILANFLLLAATITIYFINFRG